MRQRLKTDNIMQLFDTHAHYNDSRFSESEGGNEPLLDKLFSENIGYIMNASVDIADSVMNLALAEKYENLYAAVGVYPHETGKLSSDEISVLDSMEKLLSHPKAKAIGEIGLDYHYDDTDRETQKRWLRAQLSLADKLNLPVIIHDREAHADILSILSEYPGVIGVMHSYSASAEMVREFESLGYYISFSGSLTFKNNKKTVEAAAVVSEERMLIETDAPYLTPVPHRGERNDSGLMIHTAEMLAGIRGKTVDEIADITLKNAKKLFGL